MRVGRRAALGALALYVALALMALTPIRGALGQEAAPPPPQPDGFEFDPTAVAPGPQIELSATQASTARSLLERDDLLAAALGGVSYTIDAAGPWTTYGQNGAPPRLLGAYYSVTLDKPIDLTGAKLPSAPYDVTESADPPYQEVVNEVSGRGITKLDVSIDLQRGKVVEISPGPDTEELTVVPPPNFEPRVPVPDKGQAAEDFAPAAHANPQNFTLIRSREDRFWNYDFNSHTARSDNVDWAISLVFYNNATINKVKNTLSIYRYGGSTKYGRLLDGPNAPFAWDADGGRKYHPCPIRTSTRHYRIYADGDDRMYNLSWGFFVFGSIHSDNKECSPFATTSGSEDAENTLGLEWRARTRQPVLNDWMFFHNREERREGTHIWQNNGHATALRVG